MTALPDSPDHPAADLPGGRREPRDLPWRTSPGVGVLVVAGDRLLMVRQQRLSGLRWEVPGGNQEPGETLEEAAVRETLEETGLTVTPGELVCTYLLVRPARRRTSIGALLLATPTPGDAASGLPELSPHPDDETLEAAWLDPATVDADELGPVTRVAVEQWWPRRSDEHPAAPFHVHAERTADGYTVR